MSTETTLTYALIPAEPALQTAGPAMRSVDPSASPFRVVVDPIMRADLKRALLELIDHHDESLAAYIAQEKLALESYKEYIELFARSLRETMESREGILYLLKCVGVEIGDDTVNLQPEWRWK